MTWNGQEDCQWCHKELIDQNVSALQRRGKIETLPCSKHGDPRWMSDKSRAWRDFYNVVAPYCPSRTTLDHALISKICDEYGINFLAAFERLSSILRAVNEHEDTRHRHGDPRHEGAKT